MGFQVLLPTDRFVTPSRWYDRYGPWQADACESHLLQADGSQKTSLQCITLLVIKIFVQRSRSLSLRLSSYCFLFHNLSPLLCSSSLGMQNSSPYRSLLFPPVFPAEFKPIIFVPSAMPFSIISAPFSLSFSGLSSWSRQVMPLLLTSMGSRWALPLAKPLLVVGPLLELPATLPLMQRTNWYFRWPIFMNKH